MTTTMTSPVTATRTPAGARRRTGPVPRAGLYALVAGAALNTAQAVLLRASAAATRRPPGSRTPTRTRALCWR
jgi:hypothetical protein